MSMFEFNARRRIIMFHDFLLSALSSVHPSSEFYEQQALPIQVLLCTVFESSLLHGSADKNRCLTYGHVLRCFQRHTLNQEG